jgi:hypothetical protein
MFRLKHVSIAAVAAIALLGLLASPAAALLASSPSDTGSAQSTDAQDIVFKSHPTDGPASATPYVATVEVGDSGGGFDWGSAAIGAGTVIGLGVLMTGVRLLNRRRHQPAPHRAAAA